MAATAVPNLRLPLSATVIVLPLTSKAGLATAPQPQTQATVRDDHRAGLPLAAPGC
jgi:hypothetical protein